MPRILVTGATGFVGRSLCRRLIERGHRVVAAVRRPDAADSLPTAVEPLPLGEINASLACPPTTFDDIDVAIHLAARVHVLNERSRDPAAAFQDVNVLGSERLARAAAGRVKRFIYVSSVHAMCTLADEPLDETGPCRPETPYGQSKLAAEQRLRAIADKTGLELVIVRPPPVYGPGHAGNLTRLFRVAAAGWPLPLGDLRNRRSLVYVENLADALAHCAEHPAARGHTFLVSDGEDVSLSDLVARVARTSGRTPRLLPAPTRTLRLVGRATGRLPAVERLLGSLAVDSTHIRTTLAWRPPHTLDEGLSATTAWMKDAA